MQIATVCILVTVMLYGIVTALIRSKNTDKESWTQNDTFFPTRRVTILLACVGVPHKATDSQGIRHHRKASALFVSGLAATQVEHPILVYAIVFVSSRVAGIIYKYILGGVGGRFTNNRQV